ncbi:MetQ/NlpA family ABC transporter substrate-binding protein [Enterococcus dispar]|uniref:MetQ/NlpA family ABC transporter substrate-binding protein n=1 Tax=Enterococcus dispar TaxID=44009 RepID=UPI00288F1E7D|nr:MetQ/NlpA family ABC transporter substrate-binding protein [Enterococcus dispar]MDT2706260.1 MetQ/NlpA family ABC transporter substrate-binding protein [Enterococcus dispar]
MKLKKFVTGVITLGALVTLASCSSGNEKNAQTAADGAGKEVVVGVAPGPYGDMVTAVISPLTEKEGYKLTTKLFNDYVQPNKALASKQIDANLFQHTAYLEKFSADNNLDLTAIGTVPTLGMGIYSKKITRLADVKDGATVAIANDASNLARTLQLLEANNLVTIKADIDETKATVDDIAQNPKNLEFKTLDAAQLARAIDTVDLALVPGNFAWAAKLDPADALALEKLKEEYKNVFVVPTADKEGKLAKAVEKVLTSQAFKDAIAKSDFKDFDKLADWQ